MHETLECTCMDIFSFSAEFVLNYKRRGFEKLRNAYARKTGKQIWESGDVSGLTRAK